jgi:hypothetical protein
MPEGEQKPAADAAKEQPKAEVTPTEEDDLFEEFHNEGNFLTLLL